MMKLDSRFLRGSYTPVITPFQDGKVDFERFAALVDRQVREGSHGVLINGTTAEPSSLTLDERTALVREAVRTVAGRIPVVAATGSPAYAETMALTAQAEQDGADALLIVTPYYIRPPQAGLVEYFVALGRRTHLPLMIYHIPGRAAVSVTAATVASIADQLQHLVGIKHAAPDLELVSELLIRLGQEFRIFCGLESLSLPMLVIGATGLMNAVGNLAPARVAALYDRAAEGNWEEARRLHFQLFELNQAIFLDTNPIPLKYMMARMGLLANPELRLPLVELLPEAKNNLDGVLRRAGLANQLEESKSLGN